MRKAKPFEIIYKDLEAYRWSEQPRIAIRSWKSNSSLSSIIAIQARWASGPWLSRVSLFKEKRMGQVRHRTLSYSLINSTVRGSKHAAKFWPLFILSPITDALIAFLYTQVYVAYNSSVLPLPKVVMLYRIQTETKRFKDEEMGHSRHCNLTFPGYKNILSWGLALWKLNCYQYGIMTGLRTPQNILQPGKPGMAFCIESFA